MKRILVIIFLLIGFISSGQVLTEPNTYGFRFKRTVTDSLLSVPSDTFTVPTALRTIPFIARKGTTVYLWNTSSFLWQALSSGGSGTDNNNVGSGFRILKWSTQELKTLFNGYAIGIDSSSNTNGLTLKADSTLLETKLDNRRKLDSIISLLTLKLNISDTAAMLANYRHWLSGYVVNTRTVTAVAPINGGGALSSNISIGADTARSTNNLVNHGRVKQMIDSLGSASMTRNDSLMVTRNALLHDKPSSNSIVDVDTKYAGFPWAVVKKDASLKRDVVWMYLKYSTTHSDAGPMRVYKSIDGGKTWITVGNVTVGGTEISITSLQTGHFGDTTHIAYTKSTYDTVWFAKATDGLTFTSTGYVTYQYAWSGSPSINYMYKLVSDTIYAPQYEIDSDSSRAFLAYYTGGVWTRGNTILLQPGGAFPNGRGSEVAVIPYQLGASDASTSMIALIRNEDYGYYTHVKTSDNWATRTEDVTNFMYEFGNQVSYAPVRIINIDSTTYIICGNRRSNSVYGLEIVSIPTASFWTNTQSAYSKVKRTYNPLAYYNAAAIDWGYPMEFFLDNKWWVASYDTSPEYHTAAEGSDDDVRSFIMPLFGANYSEVYNDANQSITDSLNTLVSFPDIMLDGLGGFRYDGDANTIDTVYHITEDGWYDFNASLTFASSNVGSKRKAWILKVDPGFNTTATNVVIAQQTIPGNGSDADFNRIELNGKEYCRQGEWIKVFVYHDATSALNLTNTDQTIRAKFKITLLK